MSGDAWVVAFDVATSGLCVLALVGAAWAGARSSLRRNAWAGIRIPSTMRSDAAWRAGHTAAYPVSLRVAAWWAASCAVPVAALLVGVGDWSVWLGFVPLVVVVAGIVPYVKAATRAARAAE